MSLIKQALDKVQAERRREEHAGERTAPPFSGPPDAHGRPTPRDREGSPGTELILWSALIVLLSIVIGGQMVWLVTIFLL